MDWEPRVGMRVVCVNDTWYGRISPLKTGGVYTITGVNAHRASVKTTFGVEKDVLVLTLAEAKNPDRDHKTYTEGFDARRFKPLRERKTDISCFTSMLVNPPKELACTVPNRPFE